MIFENMDLALTNLKIKAKQLLSKDNVRSWKLKKNIAGSFLVKGLNILLSFVYVPLLLNYLDKERYGVWLTLTSLFDWFYFFDIGLGHGLKNRLAESLAKKDDEMARKYISTSYAVIGSISLAILVIFLFINNYLDWAKILNASPDLRFELNRLSIFLIFSFALRFTLKLLMTVLSADQRPAMGNSILFIAKLASFLVVIALMHTTESSLFNLGITLSFVPVAVLLIFTIYFFRTNYRKYIPSTRYVDFQSIKHLMNLGLKFFIIQIAVVIMFSTDNMIIAHLYSPAEVTPYNIAYKYFSVITQITSIFMAPLWISFADAYVLKDFSWITRIVKKLNKIWGILLIATILMLIMSNLIYKWWVGSDIHIPIFLSACMAFYVVIATYGAIYVNFINGVGKVQLQFYTAIGSAILNIPLSILFAKTFNMGSAGVILATAICISYGPFIAPLQYRKILNNTARGIWNK
jgi:O-antigen/teichoic acid export membrane protein